MNLTPKETKALAEIVKDRELCRSQLDIRTDSLALCQASLSIPQDPIEWYQEPSFIVGGYAVSFGLGALFVASKCFGACR